jgi:hypothetical protein
MATVKKSRCPECGDRFNTVQLMAMHRRKAHGVVGMSKSSLTKRQLANPHPVANPKPNQCGACGFQAKNAPGLNTHIKASHPQAAMKTITVVSPQTMGRKELKGEYPCALCNFVGQWKGGLTLHMSKKHPEGSVALERTTKVEVSRTRPTEEEGHFTPNGYAPSIPEGTLALALGRFQGLCQSMAVEFDLPPRLFAARLAELVYRSQVR